MCRVGLRRLLTPQSCSETWASGSHQGRGGRATGAEGGPVASPAAFGVTLGRKEGGVPGWASVSGPGQGRR